MNRTPIAAACLVLLAAVACRAAKPAPMHFYKDVDRGNSPEEEILAVTLDSDIYAATQGGFADLRVVDAQGDDVPYRLTKVTESRTETVREPCPSGVASLVENDDNSIEVVVVLDKKAPPADGLVFYTPLKDFERRVTVFGSDDGTEWHPLVTDAVIFDYSRYMDVSNREIALPKNRDRRFKAVIEEVTDQKESALMELSRQLRGGEEAGRTERTTVRRRPFRIDRLELWHNITRRRVKKDKKDAYPVVKVGTKEDAEQKRSIVTVRTRREPLTAFTLQTTSANFSRAATVQVPVAKGVTTEWVEVGRATVSAIRFRGFSQEKLKITFPEQRQPEYRIVIRNEDNPPLEITGVAAEGDVYRAECFAAEDAAYRVYYGSELAEKPHYDTAAIAVALGKGYRPVAGPLGPETVNPDFGEGPGFQFGRLLENRLFLGGVISLMVIVLALLVFRAGRRIEGLPNE